MPAVPVSVITGFLGSGKTTLLSRLLREPALERTAVIVNEFGAVGLDHLLVEASEEDVVVLDGGCVCCAVRGDLLRTACDLLARRAAGAVAFERIVVETTGLADPAPILQALITDPALAEALRLEALIATVDAALGAATLDAHPESVKQAALADRIVLTKTDLADPAANGLAERLRALNPAAPQLTAVHGALDARRLFGGGLYDAAARRPDVRRWLAADSLPPQGADHHDHARAGSRHDDAIATFCVRREAPLRAATLSLFLQTLAEHCGADLLRLKGLVEVRESPGRPALIHGVQHVFHPPAWLDAWPDGDRATRIVVIARGLDVRWVEALLEALEDEVAEQEERCSIC